METDLAVYEEGVFDLRGGKTWGGAKAPSRPPSLKETLNEVLDRNQNVHVMM